MKKAKRIIGSFPMSFDYTRGLDRRGMPLKASAISSLPNICKPCRDPSTTMHSTCTGQNCKYVFLAEMFDWRVG